MVKTAALSLFLLLTGGCATTVYPRARPASPTAVYLLDYGIHSSLLMPAGDGWYVEYAFGDWNYAALNHTWPNDALGALLISYQSTLGRRFVELAPGELAPHPRHPAPQNMQAIYASAADVQRVVDELDARYRQDAAQVLHNPDNDTDYVKDPEHYSIANNCNHLTARCLREIGCDIRGLVLLSNFSVAPVPPEAKADQAAASSNATSVTMLSAGTR